MSAHPLDKQTRIRWVAFRKTHLSALTARTECGLGALAQDVRLDRIADAHARYLLSRFNQDAHIQTDLSNPFFLGARPEDRAASVGYLDAGLSNGMVSEGIAQGVHYRDFDLSQVVYSLLSAPYHGLDLLAPHQHIGIAVHVPASAGTTDRGAGLHLQDYAVVVNMGSRRDPTLGHAKIQDIPEGELLTWPCNATEVSLPVHMHSENPDPFAGTRPSDTVGAPFYLLARRGTKLRVESAKLTNLTTGRVIPLLEPRYSDTEVFPGTDIRFPHSELMSWAIIFPSEKLAAAGPLETISADGHNGSIAEHRMRMALSATLDGKVVSKTVEFWVGYGGPNRCFFSDSRMIYNQPLNANTIE